MKLRAALVALTLTLGAISSAATIEHDLGSNLHYLRATTLSRQDLTNIANALKNFPALVLDLRSNSTADEPAAAELLEVIRQNTPPVHCTRLILLNGFTSPAIITSATQPITGVITLSPVSAALTSDVPVTITNEADQAAYTALSNGTALEKLLNANPEKTRYDEASLVRDHANGINRAKVEEPEPESPESEPPTAQEAAKAETATPSDLVLQRAVQIHRALVALKKL